MSITKAQAAQELLTRRQARKNYIDFAKYCYKGFLDPWHVHLIAKKLEGVANGSIRKLMISMPPRHSKSLNCSVCFPAWILGNHPEKRIVQAGHSADIAQHHSLDSRRIMMSPQYDKLFPNILSKDDSGIDVKQSLKEFTTCKNGGIFSVGAGGGLVGRGADIAILDDVYKSREMANSETQRNKVMDWYRSVLRTRLEPQAAQIIVSTRWSVEDLSGTLLKEEPGEWEILSLPAIKEGEYEALWPERYDHEELMSIRRTLGLHEFTAQYMCEPTVRTGNRFKVEEIDIINEDEFPKVTYIRAWDLASTAKERDKQDPDWTVGVLGAVTKDRQGLNHIWIKEVVMCQHDSFKRDEIIKRVADKDGPQVYCYIEAFGAYVDTYNHLRRLLSGRNIVRPSRLPHDKTVKASGLEPIMENGNFHICKAVWNDKFINQFREFPFSKHDDICDAVSIILGESTKAKTSLLMT